MKTCPLCGHKMEKAMYLGLPGHFCRQDGCYTLTGPALWAASIWFNGVIGIYTGSYWAALWGFLRGDWNHR